MKTEIENLLPKMMPGVVCAQMADRWNQIHLRTLRNLRDLRRYSIPVMINNVQQINATEPPAHGLPAQLEVVADS